MGDLCKAVRIGLAWGKVAASLRLYLEFERLVLTYIRSHLKILKVPIKRIFKRSISVLMTVPLCFR